MGRNMTIFWRIDYFTKTFTQMKISNIAFFSLEMHAQEGLWFFLRRFSYLLDQDEDRQVQSDVEGL